MKRKMVVAVLVVLFLAGPVLAQRKPRPLEVTLEKDSYVLYETVSGQVANLAPGENFTVELTDSNGRALIRNQVRRKGMRPTKFSFRIDFSPTIVYKVNVTTTDDRKASASLTVSPTTSIWEDFPLIVADDPSDRGTFFFAAARLIGLNACVVGPKAKPQGLLANNFRFMVRGVPGAPAFNASAPAEAQPSGAVTRTPCLSDPKLTESWLKTFDDALKTQKEFIPFGFLLGDALSVTRGTEALDYCFDTRSLENFRIMLQQRYGNVAALNRTWNTRFRRWSDVVPMTARQTIESQFGGQPRREPYNFASWFDHRVFMDKLFADALRTLTTHAHDAGRQAQTQALTGITGALEPAAYGGYDWSALVAGTTARQKLFDWLECPDRFGSKRLVNSLNRRQSRRGEAAITLAFIDPAGNAEKSARNLWRDVLLGDKGAYIKSSLGLVDKSNRLTDFAYAMAWPLRRLRDGLGRLFAHPGMLPVDDGVAIYYSHPSIRVQWMLDAGSQGGTGYLDAALTDDNSTEIASRLGWMELLDDLYISYTFVSHRALLEDVRALQGISVLILPKTVSMSDEEAKRLDRWVRAGGTLIADSQTAIFDEHAVGLDDGRLDMLFGIKRSDTQTGEVAAKSTPITKMPLRFRASGRLKAVIQNVTTDGLVPVEPGIDDRGARALLQSGPIKAVFVRKLGKGNTIYLNLSLIAYHRDRQDPAKVAGLKRLTQQLLAFVGLTPQIAVEPVADIPFDPGTVKIYRSALESIEVVGLIREQPVPVVQPVPDIKPAPIPPVAPVEPQEPPQPEVELPEQPEPPPPPEPRVEQPVEPDPDKDKPKEEEAEEPEPTPLPRAKVTLPRQCHAYDMLRGVYLGHRQQVEVALPDAAPALIACLPYEVRDVKTDVSLNGRQARYQFSLDAVPGGRVGTHVFHVEVRDPKDRKSLLNSFNVTAKSGHAAGNFYFAASDVEGTWKIIVTDVVTGKTGQTTVDLK